VAGCSHFTWAVKKDKTEPLIYAAIFLALLALRVVPRIAKGTGPVGEPAA
jgi:DMSO/TMAO reductase YedYZ heme-binding membrane subunit